MPAAISYSTYFGFCKKLYGLTGTLGSCEEQDELKQLYNVFTFEVAPHKPRRFNLAPTKITTSQQHYRALEEEIRVLKDQSRPLLILMSSIEETESFSRHLNLLNFPHLLLNEQQTMDEEHVISLAGRPKQITVATNTAGRGTDIKVSAGSLNGGGLHVIFAFYPANDRVENQGFGRAARQGQLGSGGFILSSNDPAVEEMLKIHGDLFFVLPHEKQLQLLQKQRARKVAKLSHHRSIRSTIERVHHEFLKAFLGQLEFWMGQLAFCRWEPSRWNSAKCCVKTYSQLLVEEVGYGEHSNLLVHICELRKVQSKSQFYSTLASIQEELRDKLLCLWSEHFYGKLDHFLVKEGRAPLDEQIYREQLMAFYKKVSQRWTPHLCNSGENSEGALLN